MMTKLNVSIWICSLVLFIPFTILKAQHGRIPTPAKNGMVVSSHYLASQAGMEVLKNGGNAIDAAVATAFALAVTLPSAGNIGGGGFLVYHGADGKTTTFNFREKAPAAATERMYLDADGNIKNNSNHEGPLSVGVPGTVAGLWMAHGKLGSKPWADLVKPSVELAEKGFPSTWDMQDILAYFQKQKQPVFAAAKKAFLKNGTDIYSPGELWKQPDLAASLKRIQLQGRDGFYKGETAALLEAYMKKHGGIITAKDLASYEAEELKPIVGNYRGFDIIGMPPPSSGGVAIMEMLNMLEKYDLRKMGPNSAEYLHVLTEVMRRAFADRAQYIGDPNFNKDMPIEKLISKDYAELLAASIQMDKASVSDSAAFGSLYLPKESDETTHFSVVDAWGNAVSVTYTLEYSYGSRLMADGTGFLLNNEMGDFNPVPGVTNRKGQVGTAPNLVAPHKRMLSSMTPTIVALDGKPVLVIGSPGGRTIINTVLQVILNVIDHSMNMGEAIETPRIHHQWLPDQTSMEGWGISPDTRKLYEAMGHPFTVRGKQGQAMGIYIDPTTKLRYGAADSRSFDGGAVGY
jgi:gamma-glutamyltranspeptidase/glutathione hydrolase